MSATNTVTSAKEFILFLALILVCLFIGFNLPPRIIGTLLIALIPIPITVFCLRHDLVSGVVLLFALLAVLSIWVSPLYGVAFLFEFGSLSLALAKGFKEKLPQTKIIFIAFMVNVAAAALLLGIIVITQGFRPQEFVAGQVEHQIREAVRVYEQMQLDKEQMRALTEGAQRLKGFMILAYPGLYVSMALFLVIANYLLTRWALTKMGYMVADRTPFSRLLVPDPLVWGLIGAVVLWMLGIPKLNVWGMNTTLVLSTIYIVQGLAIGIFFWTNQHLAPLFKLLVAGVILFWPPFLLLLFPLGLFDTWFDFRKLKLAKA